MLGQLSRRQEILGAALGSRLERVVGREHDPVGSGDIAISALAHSTQVLPEATIMACQRAAALAGIALGDISTKHPMTADDLISILLRLYRQGDATTRARCLDVIDQLSESRAFDLDQKLDQVH